MSLYLHHWSMRINDGDFYIGKQKLRINCNKFQILNRGTVVSQDGNRAFMANYNINSVSIIEMQVCW